MGCVCFCGYLVLVGSEGDVGVSVRGGRHSCLCYDLVTDPCLDLRLGDPGFGGVQGGLGVVGVVAKGGLGVAVTVVVSMAWMALHPWNHPLAGGGWDAELASGE